VIDDTPARREREPRPTVFEPATTAATAGVVIAQGRTRVWCTASVSTDLPPWLRPAPGEAPTRGWVTAEYAMLPGSTPDRKRRGPDSRSTEIQRLIGRSLRAAVDLDKMPGLLVTCDCDVLHADGGTRTAAITGGWVALAVALGRARAEGLLAEDPMLGPVAAISVGLLAGRPHLDLHYAWDSIAEVDLNVVMLGEGSDPAAEPRLVELQGTGERGAFRRDELDAMLDLATPTIASLMRAQREAAASLAGPTLA